MPLEVVAAVQLRVQRGRERAAHLGQVARRDQIGQHDEAGFPDRGHLALDAGAHPLIAFRFCRSRDPIRRGGSSSGSVSTFWARKTAASSL